MQHQSSVRGPVEDITVDQDHHDMDRRFTEKQAGPAGSSGPPSQARPSFPRRRLLRWLLPLLLVLCILAVVVFAPFMARVRALAVMSVYDLVYERDSVPLKLGLSVEMPLEKTDLFPLMITFNEDQGMSSWLGSPVHFTVDYAVADYTFLSDHSRFYDPESPLYGAYVGAYYLQGLGRLPDRDTVMQVAAFDQRCLALPAIGLGLKDSAFRVNAVRESSEAVSIGSYSWKCYDAAVTTNAPDHRQAGYESGAFLFGRPHASAAQYPMKEMAGRIYITYFKDQDLAVGLYIIAKDASVLAQIDRDVLSRSLLRWKSPDGASGQR
jgi:hypothetical protein